MKKSDFDLMISSIKINNPGINENIVNAFRICDRKFFVSENIYDDEPQHISHGQTISQPSTIARMISILRLKEGQDVLEIGANTSYHASLVAYIIWPGKVTTIEIFSDLAEMAKKNLKNLMKFLKNKNKDDAKKFSNVEIVNGDAFDEKNKIWKNKYDRIYFTAGVEGRHRQDVKKMALKLLKEDGLILYPTREVLDYGSLELLQYKNNKLELIRRENGYAFVPLIRQQELKELYKNKL